MDDRESFFLGGFLALGGGGFLLADDGFLLLGFLLGGFLALLLGILLGGLWLSTIFSGLAFTISGGGGIITGSLGLLGLLGIATGFLGIATGSLGFLVTGSLGFLGFVGIVTGTGTGIGTGAAGAVGAVGAAGAAGAFGVVALLALLVFFLGLVVTLEVLHGSIEFLHGSIEVKIEATNDLTDVGGCGFVHGQSDGDGVSKDECGCEEFHRYFGFGL